MRLTLLMLTLFSLIWSTHAFDSTNVLPKGINSPSFRLGTIRNVGHKFSSSGKLQTLSDNNTRAFDKNGIISITNSGSLEDIRRQNQVKNFATVVNSVVGNNAGNDVSLGFLRIDTQPQIDYFAPIYAYGYSEKVTVAIGLPVITYKNTLSVGSFGSNISDYENLRGLDPELDEGIDTLSGINLVQDFTTTLNENGYKPIRNKNETFLGDMQLMAIYKFRETKDLVLASQSTLILPTGPKDDADDLADLDIFGETAIDQKVVAEKKWAKGFSATASGALRLYIPDQLEKRVPGFDGDSLPNAASKEIVDRTLGPRLTFAGAGHYAFNDQFSAGLGLEQRFKSADQYSGSRGQRYDLLETDTAQQATLLHLGASYSSVQQYVAGNAKIPMMVSFQYTDYLAGKNIQRQTVNELWLTMFF